MASENQSLSRSAGPKVIIVGGATNRQGPRCFGQARSRGMETILIDTPELLRKAPAIVSMADYVIEIDSKHPDQINGVVERVRALSPFVGVFAVEEYSVEAAAVLAQTLGVSGNQPASVAICRNKQKCRELLSENGFTQPKSAFVASSTDVTAFVERSLSTRFVLKPNSASGSMGVHFLDRSTERTVVESAMQEYPGIQFIIEEFVHGQEYSVEGVLIRGCPKFLGVTQKFLGGHTGFVEMGHVSPAPLTLNVLRYVHSEIADVVRLIGLSSGLFHIEFWIDNGEIIVGEVHARAGGDFIHHLQEITSGVETYGAVFDDFLGKTEDCDVWPSMTGEYTRAAAIRYVSVEPGIVKSVRSLPLPDDIEVVAYKVEVSVGDTVRPLSSSNDRVAYAIVAASNPSAALAASLDAANLIKVDTEYSGGEEDRLGAATYASSTRGS